jgi:hypothetical protein
MLLLKSKLVFIGSMITVTAINHLFKGDLSSAKRFMFLLTGMTFLGKKMFTLKHDPKHATLVCNIAVDEFTEANINKQFGEEEEEVIDTTDTVKTSEDAGKKPEDDDTGKGKLKDDGGSGGGSEDIFDTMTVEEAMKLYCTIPGIKEEFSSLLDPDDVRKAKKKDDLIALVLEKADEVTVKAFIKKSAS